MAPMVRQETAEVLDEYLDMLGVNFDEITKLATSEDFFDNTKLILDNDVGLGQQPSVVLQPASPIPQPQLVDQNFIHSDSQPASPEFVVLQPATPEPFLQQALTPASVPQQDVSPDSSNIQVQPASSMPQPQLVGQDYLIHFDTQPTSPEFLMMQPANLDPLMQQVLTQAPIPQQDLSPKPYNIQVQPFIPRQLDPPQPCTSLESMTASPADSFVLTPLSVWQQVEEEKAASPNLQETVNTPKKRGRKRKYPEGMAPSRRRPRKPKVYELEPLLNEEMEKKRKNAITAKKHRDMQKEEKQKLSLELTQATSQRDQLLQIVNQYKQREQQLLEVLNMHGIKIDSLDHPLEGL